MNKEIQRRINEAMQEVRINNKTANIFTSFRCNVHDSDKHIKKMFEIWLEHRRLRIPVLTEVTFNNGSKCDILLPSQFEIIEILVTETQERLEAKKYPFKIREVKVE